MHPQSSHSRKMLFLQPTIKFEIPQDSGDEGSVIFLHSQVCQEEEKEDNKAVEERGEPDKPLFGFTSQGSRHEPVTAQSDWVKKLRLSIYPLRKRRATSANVIADVIDECIASTSAPSFAPVLSPPEAAAVAAAAAEEDKMLEASLWFPPKDQQKKFPPFKHLRARLLIQNDKVYLKKQMWERRQKYIVSLPTHFLTLQSVKFDCKTKEITLPGIKLMESSLLLMQPSNKMSPPLMHQKHITDRIYGRMKLFQMSVQLKMLEFQIHRHSLADFASEAGNTASFYRDTHLGLNEGYKKMEAQVSNIELLIQKSFPPETATQIIRQEQLEALNLWILYCQNCSQLWAKELHLLPTFPRFWDCDTKKKLYL